jgi:alpha-aminoadipate/glutamate carrier protein LysW
MVKCIECGAEVTLAKPTQGEIVECPDCGLELEVRSVNPVTVAAAPQEKEDWGE